MVLEGRSPAQEKQHEKRRLKEAKTFGEFAEKWFTESRMADSTRDMRRAIYRRINMPGLQNRQIRPKLANYTVAAKTCC